MAQFIMQNWALIAVFFTVATALWLASVSVSGTELPYVKTASLLPSDEHKLYKALISAAGGSWTVLVDVPLADALQVRNNASGTAYWRQKLESRK